MNRKTTILAVLVTLAALAAFAQTPATAPAAYELSWAIQPLRGDVSIDLQVKETATGTVISAPQVVTPADAPFEALSRNAGPAKDLNVQVLGSPGRRGVWNFTLRITRGNDVVQETKYTASNSTPLK